MDTAMWLPIITCAVGIACGIPTEVRSNNPQESVADCRLVAMLALEFLGYDDAAIKRRFVIRCDPAHVGGRAKP
jgi:hypothetical protein